MFEAAVEKAYRGRRRISWFEVYAGEKAFNRFQTWMPEDTLTAFREYLVGIKGPLTTPVGGGIRSLNVAMRQELDLYVCLRPVRYFKGMETPVKRPDLVDMVIFRENTEDIYAGIEFAAGTPEAAKMLEFRANIRRDSRRSGSVPWTKWRPGRSSWRGLARPIASRFSRSESGSSR